MTGQQKEQLRQKISDEIEATLQDIASLEEKTQPIAPDDAVGRLTRMEAINAKGIHEAALATSLAKLPKLQQSLAKINHPQFGHCKICGAEIPYERLLFMPESDRCINCVR